MKANSKGFDIRKHYTKEDSKIASEDEKPIKFSNVLPGVVAITSVSEKKSLEIEPFNSDITSFTLCFWFKTYWPKVTNGQDAEILKIGGSIGERNYVIGVTKENILYVSMKSGKGKEEFSYGQLKLKPDSDYFYTVSINIRPTGEITQYLNAQLESQQGLPSNLNVPSGFVFLGSEEKQMLFRGTFWDIKIYNRSLEAKEVRELFTNGKLTGEVDLGKTHREFQEMDGLMENSKPKRKVIIEELRSFFYSNQEMLYKVRDLCFNFELVSNTLQLLSPVITEVKALPPAFPFKNCLVAMLMDKFNEGFPVYIIEAKRMSKALKRLGSHLSFDDLILLSQMSMNLEQSKKYGPYIHYNHLLLMLMDSSLSQDEIMLIKSTLMLGDQSEILKTIKSFTKVGWTSQNFKKEYDGLKLIDQDKADSFRLKQIKFIGEKRKKIERRSEEGSAMENIYEEEVLVPIEFVLIYKHFLTEEETSQYVQLNEFENEDGAALIERILVLDDEEVINFFEVRSSRTDETILEIIFKTNEGNSHVLSLTNTAIENNYHYQQIGCGAEEFFPIFYLQTGIIDELVYLMGFGSYARYDVVYQQYKQKMIEEELAELPPIKEDWLLGKFQLVINHCAECETHQTTTNHNEAEFVEKFNELGNLLKEIFPNVEIIGNYEEPTVFENFDLYIRGIGAPQDQDNYGRIFIYKKTCSLKVLDEIFEDVQLKIYDNLILMFSAIGDTRTVEYNQETFFKKYGRFMLPPWAKFHGHPAEIPQIPAKKKGKSIKAGRQQQSELDKEPRICMNWACDATFTENENRQMRKCRCHPGLYDFGHTGMTIKQAVEEYHKEETKSEILWRPHWTCCRASWEEPGCKLIYHRGPLVKSGIERKYKWPSIMAQTFFYKKVSEHWTQFLEGQHLATPENYKKRLERAGKDLGVKFPSSYFREIPLDMLPQVCDKFKLHLLVNSENLIHHYRFFDVVSGKAHEFLDDGNGNIDPEKFWYPNLDSANGGSKKTLRPI